MQNHETKVKIIKGECPKAEHVYRAASKNVNIVFSSAVSHFIQVPISTPHIAVIE